MVRQMDMSYSYKPLLIKAIFANADSKVRVKIEDITAYFKNFYESRRKAGLIVENLTEEEKDELLKSCDEKLIEYYNRDLK